MSSGAHEEWLVLESGAGEPAWNMALDEVLLERVGAWRRPVLRRYSWTRSAATFGYSQRFADAARWTPLRPLVRRPTGGGVVPHDGDWTYSVAIPPGHWWYGLSARESYATIHGWIVRAWTGAGVRTELAPEPVPGLAGRCFAGAEAGDVLWQGRKIAGAAQRRTRQGLLIQGSIQPPPVCVPRADFDQSMLAAGESAWGCRWTVLSPAEGWRERADALALEKYGDPTYTGAR